MKAFKNILSFKSELSLQWGMQRLLIPALIISLFSCNNEPLKDVRPADQQSLVRIVKDLRDEIAKVSMTDPNREVLIDHNLKKVKAYIADTLKSQFSGWNARVLDNAKPDPNETAVRIAFGISIDNFNLEETARYKSIVFRQSLSEAEPSLREKLQKLKVGEHVKITGSFVSRDKRIDVDPYNEKEFKLSKNILVNPEFRVEITDIVVVED
jgi:hypothetical protein